jgi:hypothetical protein
VRGHRVADYPIPRARPASSAILTGRPRRACGSEIQIRHPTRDFGAFYEDLLT